MEGDQQANGSGWGTSLPVPNVQELAAAAITSNQNIPDRYIRPEIDTDPVADAEDVGLPVIDMNRLLDPKSYQEESAKLRMACEEWGFFQLINHGVDEGVVNKLKTDITEFFKLPLEEKQACAQLPDSVQGYGQAFVISEDQKLDWNDMIYIITQPPASRNMRFWPPNPPTFRDALDKYTAAIKELAERLLGFMARSVGVEPKILLAGCRVESQNVRINYYPPCPKAKDVLGLSSHTDSVVLTLLLQINETQGLQIRKDGTWLPVAVIPGAFVANVGDLLEIASNGRFKSIEHRGAADFAKERLSIATLHTTSAEAMVGPLPEFVGGGEKKYKTVSYKRYMEMVMSSRLEGRSNLESVRLTN